MREFIKTARLLNSNLIGDIEDTRDYIYDKFIRHNLNLNIEDLVKKSNEWERKNLKEICVKNTSLFYKV